MLNSDGKRFPSGNKSIIKRVSGYLESDCEALPLGDREALPTGDCEALPTGDRSSLSNYPPCSFSRENFEGVEVRLRSTSCGRSHCIPYKWSHSVFPPVPSQGKILNVLRGDCEALALARSLLEIIPRFLLKGKTWMYWGAIAQHSLWEIAKHFLWETAHSQLYIENNPVLNFYESKTKKIRSRILLSHYNQM